MICKHQFCMYFCDTETLIRKLNLRRTQVCRPIFQFHGFQKQSVRRDDQKVFEGVSSFEFLVTKKKKKKFCLWTVLHA